MDPDLYALAVESAAKATQFEAHFLPILKDADSLLSQFQDLDLKNLYVLLRAVDRVEKYLERPIGTADAWCRRPLSEEHIPFWTNHRETLKSFQKILDDRRSSVREQINERSRSHLRPLNILDLPDEILLKICWHMRRDVWYDVEYSGHLDHDSEDEARDVQNLRLTCWKLCNTSSHLLIKWLGVELSNESSLLRFKDVSMHPTISKGILIVRINLAYYDSVLATDFMTFVDWNWTKLDEKHGSWTVGLKMAEETGEAGVCGLPKVIVRQRLKKVEAILKSWSFESWQRPASRKVKKHQKMLREGHQEYQRRFAIQQRSRERGRFVETIGTAMARMPRAKKLMFRDDVTWSCRKKPFLSFFGDGQEAVRESLLKNMLLPLSWKEASEREEYAPLPADLLVKSIVAIYKAGVLPPQIDIEITPAFHFSALAPSEEDSEALAAAVQRLNNFTFRIMNRLEFWPARDLRELEDLQKFLKALLNTESLEHLWLDISGLGWDSESHKHLPFSIGSILNSRPRPILSYVRWQGIPLRPIDLERFLKGLRTKMRLLSMRDVHLVSGTWADVLDVLHNASTWASIRSSTGAEFDEMSKERREEIFGKDDDYWMGKAEGYMRGRKDKNPLRDTPAEDLLETEEPHDEN